MRIGRLLRENKKFWLGPLVLLTALIVAVCAIKGGSTLLYMYKRF
jgi:hypothetical protein